MEIEDSCDSLSQMSLDSGCFVIGNSQTEDVTDLYEQLQALRTVKPESNSYKVFSFVSHFSELARKSLEVVCSVLRPIHTGDELEFMPN